MTARQSGGGRQAGKNPPGREPPHNLDAEEALLGAIMMPSPAALNAALEVGLVEEDFYRPQHGHIFHAIRTLHSAGSPCDQISVAGQLRIDGLLEQVDAALIVQITAHAGPTSSAPHYARQILATADRRRMIGQVGEIAQHLYDGQVPNGALDLLNQMAARAARGGRGETLSVTWGEPDDVPGPSPTLIHGFLRVGELAVVAAPRGIGKTFFTYNLAKLLADGHGRLMGTLDVARPARVLLCQGELEEWQSYARWKAIGGKPKNVAETWDPWRIRVQRHRRPTGDGGWDEWIDATIDPALEQAIIDDGVEVLVIDPWRTYYAGSENSNDETEQALAALTAMARRTGISIVIIHHLSLKNVDLAKVTEPEDLWRGATRLADWASTRVTILPHYSSKAAEEAGISRKIARSHVDVHFLRRAEPTDDFCAVLNAETGWWERWETGVVGAGQRRSTSSSAAASAPGGSGMPDVAEHYQWIADACARDGGGWRSQREASMSLGKSSEVTGKLLNMAARHGLLERYHITGNQYGYRLPSKSPGELNFDDRPPLRLVDPTPEDDTDR